MPDPLDLDLKNHYKVRAVTTNMKIMFFPADTLFPKLMTLVYDAPLEFFNSDHTGLR